MSEVVIFQAEDGKTKLEVQLEKDTVWLSQKQMSELLDKDTDTIGLHIRNIYKEGELEPESTTEESSVVQKEGNRKVRRKLKFYNLDVIISVGYRVKSQRGIQFRQWPTRVFRNQPSESRLKCFCDMDGEQQEYLPLPFIQNSPCCLHQLRQIQGL